MRGYTVLGEKRAGKQEDRKKGAGVRERRRKANRRTERVNNEQARRVEGQKGK